MLMLYVLELELQLVILNLLEDVDPEIGSAHRAADRLVGANLMLNPDSDAG